MNFCKYRLANQELECYICSIGGSKTCSELLAEKKCPIGTELTCSGCGNTWYYRGLKRPIKRAGKPDKTVYVTCTRCSNKVPISAKDVLE